MYIFGQEILGSATTYDIDIEMIGNKTSKLVMTSIRWSNVIQEKWSSFR